MIKTMGKSKNIVIGLVLGLSLTFGFSVAADNYNDTAGCHGSYANGVGEIVRCD